MKNKLLLVTSLLALTLLFGVMSNTARAGIIPSGIIQDWKWLGYAYHSTDLFHGTSVYAYEENSTATFSVTVYNDYVSDKPLNISALKVGFDWGINYTSSQTSMGNPFVIPWHERRVIPIVFTVPTLTAVSNRAQYSYTIYLEHVNSTTGPKSIIDSDRRFIGSDFVVYSADQVGAQKTMQMVAIMQSVTSADDFNSTKAKLLWVKAENETSVAELLYKQADFAGSKNHYETALSLINQALEAEEKKGGGLDDAQVQVLQAQAESLKASANYLNGLSNMWILIGVAAILFAIGYIIRGLGSLRKPSMVATA